MGQGQFRVVSNTGPVYPFFIWADTSSPNFVYYTDPQHHSIYKTTLNQVPALVAGTGTAGYDSSTNSLTTRFNRPHGIFGDQFRLYICDTINYAVRTVTLADNTVATIGKFV
jgi:hypothetical protein